MENNETQTRKSKTKNSTKPKTEKEEGLKKRPIWKWLFIILLARSFPKKKVPCGFSFLLFSIPS